MADYYLDENGNWTSSKEKKKKKEQEAKQPDYVLGADGNWKDNDIAPVNGGNWYDGYLEAPAFDDGYQFGDVVKTILGTGNDIAENINQAVFDATENLVDTAAYGIGGVVGLFSAEGQDAISNFIAEDYSKSVGEWFNDFAQKTTPFGLLVGETDEYSVLGDKAEGLVQSGAHLAGQIALQAVGVPWWVTSSVNSFGGEIEQALGQDATYEMAGLSGAITTGAELLSEKLFGGSGLGEKGLINLDGLTKGISSKVVKAIVDFGVDATAEGIEEIASSVISKLGQAFYKVEDPAELAEFLTNEEAVNEYIDSFVGGVLLGGGANAGKVVNSVKDRTDYRTGLSTNEEAVVKRVVDDAIKEAEEKGKKLTDKDKKKLYADTVNKMERGEISINTIEEVLGGESYTAYADAVAKDKALFEEYEAKAKEFTESGDTDGLLDIATKWGNLKNSSQQAELKGKLSQSTFDTILKDRNGKGSILGRSYVETANRGKKFDVDVNSYDEKYRGTVQRAIDSGILNNTRRTREFVEFLAKLEADKGVKFDFLNNEKLKGTSFARDDAFVNGYFDRKSNTIGVNIDSAKAWQSTIGHEVTHVLEGTGELYNEVQKALFEYAEAKGELESRRKSLSELYDEADIDSELTADLVGDYLFTDEDFIKHLSTKNKKGFMKIFDEIKYLCKIATAGSKEKRQLEALKHKFEQIYRADVKADGNEKVQHSVSSENPLDKNAQMRYNNGKNWATNNGILNAGQMDNFYSRFSAITANLESAEGRITKSGEYMIPVSDIYDNSREGIQNVIVYAKGTLDDPIITAVLEIDADNETKLNDIRRQVYETERRGIQQKTEGIFRRYDPSDFTNARIGQRGLVRGNGHNNQFGAERGTSGRKAARAVSYRTTEEGHKVYDLTPYEASSNDDVFFDAESWQGKVEALYTTILDGVSDSVKRRMPTLDEVLSAERTSFGDFRAVERMLAGVLDELDAGGRTYGESKKLENAVNEIKRLLTENGNSDVKHSLSSISNTFFGDENMSALAFKEADYTQTQGYKDYVEKCVNNMRQTRTDFDEATARKQIEDSIDGIVRVALAAKQAGYDIYDDATKRDKKDSKNRLLFSSLEPNSDYFTSNDISTICDKRQNFAEIYDDIVRAEEAKGVPQGKRFFDNVDNYFYLHKLMADKGLTQPCRQCYVESMRKNLAPMANAFLRLVGETNPNNTANDQLYEQKGKNKGNLKSNNAATREWVLEKLSEYGMTAADLSVETLTTEDGLAQLKIQAPMIYEAFNSFYGQSKPKMPKSATPFRFGELTALLTDNKGKIKQGLVDKINSTGGFRLQSYSDFQIQNYTDVLQVIFEAGTLGLNGHAYTKVPAFLEATEGTNLKRNISIFMYKDGGEWKLDRNDSFPYTLDEIYDIVKADENGNTSIIAVSQNNEMSAWIMANDLVGYGIPFHKSGMKMGTVRDTDVKTEDGRIVKGYADTKDHTKQQTEVWATTTADHKAFTKVKKGINIYGEEVGWDFENKDNLSRNELIEKNLKAYIDACEKVGYIPKFRDYVMNNGKVLADVLKYSKELGFVSPDATIEDISFEYKGYTIPYGYYKFLGDFGMFTPDGQTAPQKPLSLENYDFDKAVEFFGNSEELHRNEILQQFANGKEREIYRNSDLTAEQLTEIIKQRRTEIADSVVSGQASLSPMDEAPTQYGDFYTPANEMRFEAPMREDIAPVAEGDWVNKDIAPVAENVGADIIPNETRVYAGDRGNIGTVKGYNEETNEYSVFFKAKNGNTATKNISADEISPLNENKASEDMGEEPKVAKVLVDEPELPKEKRNILNKIRANFVDKGSAVEDLALKTGNRELDAKYNFMHYSESRAQSYIGKNLNPLIERIEQTGKTDQFFNYAYHLHNIDRMSLESKAQEKIAALNGKFGHLRLDQIKAIAATKITEKTTERTAQTIREAKEYLNAMETKNKPVFGDTVTADVSREEVKRFEAENPEFKELSEAVIAYNADLRRMLVEGGVISQATADLWAKESPHYVPIRRDGKSGIGITVPLDTNKTGVNAPIKRATGGNSDILPLLDTMAMRTQQTFKAIAKNSFGIELMHTLNPTTQSESASIDDVLDGFENHEELLQKGKNGKKPTFTVFENGKRVTFEISEDMYDALKPTSEGLAYTSKALNWLNKRRREIITEYNPAFMFTNPIKDAQDVLMNSQHAAATYKNFPRAIAELWGKGKWFTEYMENGGEDNTYFDGKTNTFTKDTTGIKKWLGKISEANNFIERIPRLAEYIASREAGASIEVAMLDSARVTTNFAAGGDVTKFANRNGFTFLNASVQGAAQNVRNLREAKAQGFKGWVKLAAKCAIAGLPAVLLNHLLWGDDEEYEELSDYVKDNYYIVAKYGDGQFVRIPKGRTLAVIQDAFEQMGNMLTGNDEVDLANFLELTISNLAPNNPLDNNIIAPIGQALSNKTWYGEDLVPSRLQDLPEAEQYDESTDALSKWLGETFNVSPYKINYVLDQYSGALGDIFLPMMTPESDGGGLLAPLADKFTTDSVLNNQNVSDFYDTMDELTKKANSMYATDEDVLAYKYMSTINSELGELYGKKREVQNSNLSDSAKDEAIRSLQEKINSLARNGLSSYGNAVSGGASVVGDKLYGEYTLAKAMGGYKTYKSYTSALNDIKGDKNANGTTISGSRKKKVIAYINSLDADYGEKIILYKKAYSSDDTYNYEIIEYLNSRDDISYKEMEAILKELGFTVRADGSITWD